MLLTGEIGTGKTTLIRTLAQKLHDKAEIAIIFNPYLDEKGLLKSILADFGVQTPKHASKQDLLLRMNTFLLQCASEGKLAVLIIDEAQNLPFELFEELRMLSNLETDQEKLLQLVLVGQPQLNRIIAHPELEQLRQRIAIRDHLGRLDLASARRYINHRIKVAAPRHYPAFDKGAYRAIQNYSKGVPRLINQVCDKALLGAYVMGTTHICKKIVKEAIMTMEGKSPSQDLEALNMGRYIVIGLFFALIVFSIGYIVLSAVSGKEPGNPWYQPTSTPTPSPTAIPTLTPTPTVYLETYRDEYEHFKTGDSSQATGRLLGWILYLYERRKNRDVDPTEYLFDLELESLMEIELDANFNLVAGKFTRRDLETIGYPIIISLYDDRGITSEYFILRGKRDAAHVVCNPSSGIIELGADDLKRRYSGESYYLESSDLKIRQLLGIGARGEQVVALRKMLVKQGFLEPGQCCDGIFDEQLKEAVIRAQKQKGLIPDGIVGVKTVLALLYEPFEETY